MEQLTSERLQDNLQRLKLSRAAEVLDTIAWEAEANKSSYLAFLDHLLEEEVAAKDTRRVQTAMKTAGLPGAKTIEEYDFSFHPHLDKKMVMELFDLDFITKHENVVFLGPPGVGKTHLANAIGQLACLRGYRVRFVSAADLVNDLVSGQARNTLHRRLVAWTAPDLLLIDELGYLSFDARGADLLYQVFNRRYQRAATTVTTNLAFKDWGTLFHNTAAASAIADRLVHKGLLIRITGKSRRSDKEVGAE